jgi:hypothetical protein
VLHQLRGGRGPAGREGPQGSIGHQGVPGLVGPRWPARTGRRRHPGRHGASGSQRHGLHLDGRVGAAQIRRRRSRRLQRLGLHLHCHLRTGTAGRLGPARRQRRTRAAGSRMEGRMEGRHLQQGPSGPARWLILHLPHRMQHGTASGRMGSARRQRRSWDTGATGSAGTERCHRTRRTHRADRSAGTDRSDRRYWRHGSDGSQVMKHTRHVALGTPNPAHPHRFTPARAAPFTRD